MKITQITAATNEQGDILFALGDDGCLYMRRYVFKLSPTEENPCATEWSYYWELQEYPVGIPERFEEEPEPATQSPAATESEGVWTTYTIPEDLRPLYERAGRHVGPAASMDFAIFPQLLCTIIERLAKAELNLQLELTVRQDLEAKLAEARKSR